MKRIWKTILFGTLMMGMLLPQLGLPVSAETEKADWRRVVGAPTITFNDIEGKELSTELKNLPEDTKGLSYTSSTVQLAGKDKINYSSADLTFSYVDYNYKVESIIDSNGDYGGPNLPKNEDIVAQLEYAGKTYEDSSVKCGMSSKGYLSVDVIFENIIFDDLNKDAELFLQYAYEDAKTQETNTVKGTVKYTFQNLQVIDLTEKPEDVEKEEIKVEVNVPSNDKDDDDSIRSSTPYVLIDSCTIDDGRSSVAAGSSFALALNCSNSHKKINIENLLLQVDTPAELKLEHPSNTFHIGKVEDKKSFLKTLNFTIDSEAPAKNYEIGLTFHYEYVDDGSRRYETMTSRVQVPVTQGFSFALEPIAVKNDYYVGEEYKLYSPFANEGKSPICNLRAELVGEGLESEQKILRLGEAPAGDGGEAVFLVSSRESGSFPFKVLYTYENSLGQQFEKTVEAELAFVAKPEEEKEEPTEPVIQYVTALPAESTMDDRSLLTVVLAAGACVLFFLILLKVEHKERK